MESGNTTLMIVLPSALKDALGIYATRYDLSMSEIVRQAIKDKIRYNVSVPKKSHGNQKYTTPEDKKQARKEREALYKKLVKGSNNND